MEKLEKQNLAINTELSDYREKVRALKVEKTTLRERPVSNRQMTKSRADMLTLERQKMSSTLSTPTPTTNLSVPSDATGRGRKASLVGQTKCDACAHVNDVGRLFCGECGVKLSPAAMPNARPVNQQQAANASLRTSSRTQNLQQLKEEQEKVLVTV
jgi:hypothetical protein